MARGTIYYYLLYNANTFLGFCPQDMRLCAVVLQLEGLAILVEIVVYHPSGDDRAIDGKLIRFHRNKV